MPVRTRAWSSTRNTRIVIAFSLSPLCRWPASPLSRPLQPPAYGLIMPSNRGNRTFPMPHRPEVRQRAGKSAGRRSHLAGASCPGWQRAHRAPRTGHADAGELHRMQLRQHCNRDTDSRMRTPCYTPPNTRMAALPQPARREALRPAFSLRHTGLPRQAGFLCVAAGDGTRCGGAAARAGSTPDREVAGSEQGYPRYRCDISFPPDAHQLICGCDHIWRRLWPRPRTRATTT